ncbi:MAG: M48 family metalloprotease, partial [Planctomycetaceae bacterium]|nr:M48 family metalloprotease [Planctomycetaceae bacterium]
GIIGLAAYGVYWHAASNVDMFSGTQGRGVVMVFLVYLTPMIIGGILVVFMFKPLFSRSPHSERWRSLTRDDQPLLFAFVERICDAVGAAHPSRINLDVQVNASASFRRGWLSFLGNDLVLTIGMPLVAGMSTRQFAGVLAHEFGHFSQGAGMRLTYVIRVISHWFTRVVYERDAWDEKLKDAARSIDLRIGWILYLAMLFIWITRKILWVLMMIGHAVSGLMLRQMEYDADRYEARLAGSDTFETTARQLQMLGLAHHGAMSDLGDFYREGRLADNLPALIMANVDQLPKEAAEHIDKQLETATTGWFDTHPSDKERIASARLEDTDGIFRLKGPASQLFNSFAKHSKYVTFDYYRQVFGDELKREELHPIDELLERQGEEQETFKTLHRYYQAQYSPLRPLSLPQWIIAAPDNPKVCATALKESREKMLAALPKYKRRFKKYDEADSQSIELAQAQALSNAKLRIGRDLFSIDLSSKERVREASSSLRIEKQTLVDGLQRFEAAATRRLYCALQLSKVEKVAARLENAAEWQAEVKRIVTSLQAVNSHIDGLTKLRNDQASMGMLFQNLEGNEENERLIDAIRRRMEAIDNDIRKIRRPLNSVDYPFDHAKGEISIAKFALPDLPDSEVPGEIYEAADALINSIYRLAARLTGRLCVLAEQVETLLGLEPLPEPPEEEKPEETAEDQ